MNDFAQLATSTFEQTVGFSAQSMIDFATSSVIRTYVGGILSVMYYQTSWVIAFAAILTIVFFAFAMFRILRV